MQPRNTSIDSLKFLAAFFVVCIHAPFPGGLGQDVVAVARFAVPVFFMISGFYFGPDGTAANALDQSRKILKILISSNVIFFAFQTLLRIHAGTTFQHAVSEQVGFRKMANFLVFGESPFGFHLWYLSGIYCVYLVQLGVLRWNLKRIVSWCVPFLLLTDLVLGKYSILLFDRTFPYIWVRNFVFVGIPYFTIGTWIRKRDLVHPLRARAWAIAFFAALFAATTVLERHFLVGLGANSTRDHYLSTTLLSISLLVGAISFPNIGLFSQWGKKHTTSIYIYHPILIPILGSVFSHLDAGLALRYIQPLAVFIVTVGAVVSFASVHSWISGRFFPKEIVK